MQFQQVRYTELPAVNRLFLDFLYRFPQVAAFYPRDPDRLDQIRQSAAQKPYPAERRQRLVRVLRKQNSDTDALDRLARPDAVAVVTGQQTGLFLGPAYTVYKALTALRLAEELNAQGTPAVAVFWLASEDHDYAEVNHCRVFDAEGRPQRLALPETGRQDRRPAGAVALPDGLPQTLHQALRGLPFAEEVAARAAQAYAPGSTLSEAFRVLMLALPGSRGLLCFDPLTPEARELLAPALAQAAEAGPELAELVLRRTQELTEAGYMPQVHFEAQSSLLFLLEGGQRLPLRREADRYSCGGRRMTPRDLVARAEQLSPGALLRPLIQDWVLPTVVSVVGPAEIAYLAQAAPLYRALQTEAPWWIPRISLTLLDTRAERLMRRYQLGLEDFLRGEEHLRAAIARRLIPESLRQELERAGRQIRESLDGLSAALSAFDPTLERALEKSRSKMLYQLSKTERKIAREVLRRQERAVQDAEWLWRRVLPERRLQERYYSILPFLAQQGPDLLERLRQKWPSDWRHHHVLVV